MSQKRAHQGVLIARSTHLGVRLGLGSGLGLGLGLGKLDARGTHLRDKPAGHTGHARGRYVYVPCVAPWGKLPCASGTARTPRHISAQVPAGVVESCRPDHRLAHAAS